MRVVWMIAASATFVSGTALADPQAAAPAPAPAPAPQAKQDDGNKLVCHSERMVGSNLSERICHTKAEWEAARQNAQQSLDRHNGQLTAPTRRGNGG